MRPHLAWTEYRLADVLLRRGRKEDVPRARILAERARTSADSMGMKRNYLYRVLPALEKEGTITKHGKGYHPAGAAA